MDKIKRAVVNAGLLSDWIESCKLRLPFEACGVVYGDYADEALHIRDFAMVRNAAAEPENSFSFDPADWIRIWYDAELRGKPLVGIFHSHPNGAANPSRIDSLHRMIWGTYWIIGLSGPDCKLAGFRPVSGGEEQWQPLAVHID